MRNLMKYANKCMKLMDDARIPYNPPRNWRVSKRMTRAYGMFRHGGGVNEIVISSRLMDERIPEEILENTIIHELIHTNDTCHNHGLQFHTYGRQVKDRLGYDIETYVSKSDKATVDTVYKPKDRPYVVYCPSCKAEFSYAIKGNVWKHPDRYVCRKCRQRLVRKSA